MKELIAATALVLLAFTVPADATCTSNPFAGWGIDSSCTVVPVPAPPAPVPTPSPSPTPAPVSSPSPLPVTTCTNNPFGAWGGGGGTFCYTSNPSPSPAPRPTPSPSPSPAPRPTPSPSPSPAPTPTPPPSAGPTCSVSGDGTSLVIVDFYNVPVTGYAVSDIINVAVVKASGTYRGFTTSGSAVPGSDGHGSVVFHLGSGAGDYSVTLTGSQFGHVQCTAFTLR